MPFSALGVWNNLLVEFKKYSSAHYYDIELSKRFANLTLQITQNVRTQRCWTASTMSSVLNWIKRTSVLISLNKTHLGFGPMWINTRNVNKKSLLNLRLLITSLKKKSKNVVCTQIHSFLKLDFVTFIKHKQ